MGLPNAPRDTTLWRVLPPGEHDRKYRQADSEPQAQTYFREHFCTPLIGFSDNIFVLNSIFRCTKTGIIFHLTSEYCKLGKPQCRSTFHRRIPFKPVNYTVWVKKIPKRFSEIFSQTVENFNQFFTHLLCATLEYKFLFKYLQLWQSYAIPSATT